MNGKAAKYCRMFAHNSYEATPEAERPQAFRTYCQNIKREYTRNSDFKKFIQAANKF